MKSNRDQRQNLPNIAFFWIGRSPHVHQPSPRSCAFLLWSACKVASSRLFRLTGLTGASTMRLSFSVTHFPLPGIPLFRIAIHFLLCLIVLACPAMGGNCCGRESGLGDRVQSERQAVETHHCCCCSHEAPVDRDLPSVPTRPDSHDQCHTCLCGGALPAGSSAANLIHVASKHIQPDCLLAVRGHSVASFDDLAGYSPPAGRAMLTLHCRLLI